MRWGEDFFVICALIAIAIFLIVNFIKLFCGIRNNCKSSRERELVRQAAVYTIATDPRRGNDSTSNFPDFFWDVSPPRSNEPAKDDKDLPSYEEVMRIEMARQVVDSTIQATPITTSTTTNTVQQTLPSSQPVRLPV
ncbi:uncharacterized protein LOC129906287 isoform X5 [Episyrphus balteatus]|uniref:uncharacterized protein LOC129906287 isoform X5 n=1 Tax=Episyrphus balteatus TaxID=286459 RepID=UPI002485A959|nr:uncharacterized protein LOC129906287 isoform X5 [Episyrphus balteatus]